MEVTPAGGVHVDDSTVVFTTTVIHHLYVLVVYNVYSVIIHDSTLKIIRLSPAAITESERSVSLLSKLYVAAAPVTMDFISSDPIIRFPPDVSDPAA
jgi:hypothetical protein